MKENEKNPVLEMAEQAMLNCEEAFRNGLKIQEEAGQRLTALFSPSRQKQNQYSLFATLLDEMIPATQQRIEEILELVSKNTQSTAELLKKATEATQATSLSESQGKWIEFWKSSVRVTRSNADSLMHVNQRTIDSWLDLLQKTMEAAPVRPENTGKAKG